MRLLDLFCGAGGAGAGYARAGFEVTGVDINAQPNYPFAFVRGDALAYLAEHGQEFDAVHASPPCQTFSRKRASWGRAAVRTIEYPDLVEPTRALLELNARPWILENVPGAPLEAGMLLCGTMFGLAITKHRLFEVGGGWSLPILAPAGCNHEAVYSPWRGDGRNSRRHRAAMGTPWIPEGGGQSRLEGRTGDLFNAIPPAYTEWIGGLLLDRLGRQLELELDRLANSLEPA